MICHLDGSPFKRFDSAWRATCRAAGIKSFHFHDVRHTFCSNLLLPGADLKEVKEMIGHGDISMTDRYSHLTSEHK
ncbi:MAG: tyrosine-type recombinase/integrase, partial [Desulfoferrobacter sp.]